MTHLPALLPERDRPTHQTRHTLRRGSTPARGGIARAPSRPPDRFRVGGAHERLHERRERGRRSVLACCCDRRLRRFFFFFKMIRPPQNPPLSPPPPLSR